MRFLAQLRSQREQPKQSRTWPRFQSAAGTDEIPLPAANSDKNCSAVTSACEVDVNLLRQENRILGCLSDVQLLSSGIVMGPEPAGWWQPDMQVPDVPLDFAEHLQMHLASAKGITASPAAEREAVGDCHSPTECLELLLLQARQSRSSGAAAVWRPGSVAAFSDGAVSVTSEEIARLLRVAWQVQNGTGNPAAAEGPGSRVASNDACATSEDIQRLLCIARQMEIENNTGSPVQPSSSRVLSKEGTSAASKDVQKPHRGGRQAEDSCGSDAGSSASVDPQPAPPLPQMTVPQPRAAPSSYQAHALTALAEWLDEGLLLAEATVWLEPEALRQLPFPEVGDLHLHLAPARLANKSKTGSSASGRRDLRVKQEGNEGSQQKERQLTKGHGLPFEFHPG